jgi:hypothetical protein
MNVMKVFSSLDHSLILKKISTEIYCQQEICMSDWLRNAFQMLHMLLLDGELQLGMETTKANPQLLSALVMPERNSSPTGCQFC